MIRIFLIIQLLLFSSCSIVQSLTLNSMSDVVYQSGYSMETVQDWDHLREVLPATVQMNDSLLFLKPENQKFLLTGLKGHASIAFAIHETLYIEDFINMKENSQHKRKALISYSKAIKYGKRYLKLKGVDLGSLMQVDIPKLLDEKMNIETQDLEAVFFTAQSLGGFINLNKDKMTYVSRLPIVKGLFDWVCKHRPELNYGACGIFYGAYEAGRPKMLGGNPAKGKQYFLKTIKKNPDNWLVRVSYMQYYLIPMMDENGYKKQKYFMEKNQKLLEKNKIWIPGGHRKDSITGNKHLRAFQAIAVERYKIIKKYESEIF